MPQHLTARMQLSEELKRVKGIEAKLTEIIDNPKTLQGAAVTAIWARLFISKPIATGQKALRSKDEATHATAIEELKAWQWTDKNIYKEQQQP